MTPRAFLFFLALLPYSAFADSGRFCVQSFNVYGPAYASNVSYRLTRLADELVKDPCAATQFQEFWRDSDYQNFLAQTSSARLAFVRADEARRDRAMTGLASAFSGHVLSARSALFRLNNEGGVLDWFRNLGGVQKGYSLLEVKLDHGPLALFANLHDHPTEESIRVAQVAELTLALLGDPRAAELPLILTGDLNSTPESPELDLLRDLLLLRDSYSEARGGYSGECTYCGDNPLSWSSEDRVIDFVMVRNSPKLAFRVEKSEINLRGEQYDPLSDHFGVRSDLLWDDRETSFLEVNHPIVSARMEKARATLSNALRILDGLEKFPAYLKPLRDLEDALDGGRLPSELNHFLVP